MPTLPSAPVRTRSHDIGDRVVRMRPWPRPGRSGGALLVLTDHRHRPPTEQVERWVDELRSQGYSHVRTGAVEPAVARSFHAAGFVEAQRLALLQAEPPQPPSDAHRRLRTMRTVADDDVAAAIDLAAFGPEWCFDATAIGDAREATPAHRARFALGAGDRPTGYAITGRAGRHGFLQRLAVAPDAQGAGHGSALVADSLRWLRRWRVQTVLVNTEVGNDVALRLYRRNGFEVLPEHLVVLECRL